MQSLTASHKLIVLDKLNILNFLKFYQLYINFHLLLHYEVLEKDKLNLNDNKSDSDNNTFISKNNV